MRDLVTRGLELLLRHQAPGGAFPAAPDFPPYRYCWLRDGSFIAHALDLWGYPDAAAAFHAWAASAILRHADKVQRAFAALAAGRQPHYDDFLHTRYTLDGHEGREPWGNFQLDGYGAWLWSLGAHAAAGRPLEAAVARAAALTAAYLAAFWDRRCFDPWEEFPDHRHTSTLAAVYGGLEAARRMPGVAGAAAAVSLEATSAAVRRFVLDRGVVDGALTKWLSDAPVAAARAGAVPHPAPARCPVPDSSLLWVAVPFGLLPADDPIVEATVALIERDLRGGCAAAAAPLGATGDGAVSSAPAGGAPAGGVRRYAADRFYGGGEWVVLAAWLGWYFCARGHPGRARPLLDWVEAQYDARGLPEQVPGPRTNRAAYDAWLCRWGPVARPLLWSHAMHLILAHCLEPSPAV